MVALGRVLFLRAKHPCIPLLTVNWIQASGCTVRNLIPASIMNTIPPQGTGAVSPISVGMAPRTGLGYPHIGPFVGPLPDEEENILKDLKDLYQKNTARNWL